MTSPAAALRPVAQPIGQVRAGTQTDSSLERRQELVAKLTSAAEDVAQDAFAGLRWHDFRASAGIELVASLAQELAGTELLPKRAQAARLRMLLAGLKMDGTDVQGLAQIAREFPAHLRVTALEFLPLDMRRAAYEEGLRDAAPAPATITADSAQLVTPDVTPCFEYSLASDAEIDTVHATGTFSHTEIAVTYSTVLLLSHPDRQEGNRKLLADADMDPIIIESLSALRQNLMVSTEISACVVDRSFLERLSESDQRALFTELAAYSTFIRIRVDDGSLRLSYEDIRQIIKRSRGLGTAIPDTALSFEADGTVRPSEIDDFRRARDLLRSHEGTEFIVGELSRAEGRLLVAAARARIQAERLDGMIEVRSLTTRFLPGGRSGARLATIRVNDGGRTFVAKITSKVCALDEIRRFRVFVQEWDPQLQPEPYFHGEEAVILTGLVPSDDDRSIPAAMLQDRIAELWNKQWMGEHDATELNRRAEALGRGLERTARDLAGLNALKPQAAGFPCYVNPPMEHIAALETGGFDWGLDADALLARAKAVERYKWLKHAGVVHGDVHLRNMLIRGDSEIHLIDYASSGPGHPALDLVRLELSLYLGPVRQFEPESRCIALQQELSIDRVSLTMLAEHFPTFFQCHVNGACARGMIAARDQVLEVVRTHDGDSRDYLATKYLLAWQHLGLIGSHTGLARVVIAALAPEIGSW